MVVPRQEPVETAWGSESVAGMAAAVVVLEEPCAGKPLRWWYWQSLVV